MEQPALDAAMRLLEHPEIAARQMPAAFNSPSVVALSIALSLFGYLAWAFCLGAIAEGVARLYGASTIEFAVCWQAVLRRWPSIVAVLSLSAFAMVLCDATAIALVTIFVSLTVVFAPASLPIITVCAMLFVLLTATVTPALLAMPCVFGFYGSTLESLGAVAAVRVSFSRIFTRAEFRRSVICATAVGTLAFGCSAVLGVFGILGLARWTAVYVALDALARTLLVPLSGSFWPSTTSTYAFDTKVST
jgi:hypothetical protein